MEELIQRLKRLIEEEILLHNSRKLNEAEINHLIEEISQKFLIDYETQRKYVSQVIQIYEKSTSHVLNILFPIFFERLNKLNELNIIPIDLQLWEREFDIDEVDRNYKSFFNSQLSKNPKVRLSGDVPSLAIDPDTGEKFLWFIYRLIEPQAKSLNQSPEEVNVTLLHLVLARWIANAINRNELFYLMILIFFDSLYSKGNYQLARDLSEECLICSYKDQRQELGYYLLFKVFASTRNAVSALHYVIIATTAYLNKGQIFDYFIKNMHWEAMKFTRNIGLIPYTRFLFEDRPKNVAYSPYDLNKIHHAYYSSLLQVQDNILPTIVLEYLDKYKEAMIAGGEHEILPWIDMLLNITKSYSESQYDNDHLNRYLKYFRPMVSSSKYDKAYNLHFGGLEDKMQVLKDSLLKLSFTRNTSDFITDNELAIKISYHTVLESFNRQSIEGYLLSMILQSDFSIVFKNKVTKPLIDVKTYFLHREFRNEYYSPEFLNEFILTMESSCILWLGSDRNKILPLFYDNGSFKFINDKNRYMAAVKTFEDTTFQTLSHDTIVQAKKREKLYEDYLQEEESIKEAVNFLELPIDPDKTLLIIKDIAMSSFPHNLITSKNDFITVRVPSSNIMSLEWFIENGGSQLIDKGSISMWIPIESQDFAICMMHSKMEEDITKFNIITHTKILPDYPLGSNINILVAHGSQNITTFPAFYLKGEKSISSIRNMDHIVGHGNILILFVCHSGSERSDLFANQTLTIIKQFLQTGYKAVVAPFWALHIDIPPIWMPEFLNSLFQGFDIATSVLKANKKVSTIYNTPKAYACLHLYGNPFIKLI